VEGDVIPGETGTELFRNWVPKDVSD